jgi:hypothetical protein
MTPDNNLRLLEESELETIVKQIEDEKEQQKEGEKQSKQ